MRAKTLIFMTSNLGAAEMSAMTSPELGFAASRPEPKDLRSDKISQRISKAGISAARRKFTPEFINRLDKIVVFKTLGDEELRQILDLELAYVQKRVFNGTPFLFQLTSSAKDFLLEQGTDAKYGARHLKRSIERSLVYPMANLIATEQIHAGDLVEIDFAEGHTEMTFERADEDLPVYAMFRAAGLDLPEDYEINPGPVVVPRPAANGIHSLTRR